MLTDAIYEEALTVITTMIDSISDIDPSIEGYIDLLEYAMEEIGVCLSAAKCDLENEIEDLK